MQFEFTAVVRTRFDHAKGATKSKLLGTDIFLELSPELDRKVYLKDDLPTVEGSKALTITLISGLVANIHTCHQYGFRDSAEHLRYIIAELERGFAMVANVSDGHF